MVERRSLKKAEAGQEYIVTQINTDDEEMKGFLFRLGCYKGEKLTLISVINKNYVVLIKNTRYGIDEDLAEVILV